MKSSLLSLMLCTGLLAGMQAQAAPISLINAGFEADWASTAAVGSDGAVTFNYGPTGPNVGWAFTGGGGVASNYNNGLFNAYEGNRFGLLQLGSSFSQTFSLDSASDVNLSFAMALRPGYDSGQHVSVALDGVALQDFVATLGWSIETLGLGSLTSGSHVLSFEGTADYYTYGDTTAFLDSVQLNAFAAPVSVPEPETLAMLLAGLGALAAARRRKIRSAV